MILKEVFQKKVDGPLMFFSNGYAYCYDKTLTIIRKLRLDDFKVVGEIRHGSGDFGYDTNGDYFLLEDSDNNSATVYYLPDLKEVHSFSYQSRENRPTEIYGYEDYLFILSEKGIYRFDKENWNSVKVADLDGLTEFCRRKDNIFVCKDFYNLYIYKMNEDSMNIILHIKMDDIFPEDEVRKFIPDYRNKEMPGFSEDMRLCYVLPYKNDLIAVTNVGIFRMTMDGKIVWRTIRYVEDNIEIAGHYGYVTYNGAFYRVDLESGDLDLYGNDGKMPELVYNGRNLWLSGMHFVYRNGYIWRMVYADGMVLLAVIEPETGKFVYFYKLNGASGNACEFCFINSKVYVYDLWTNEFHVLEEIEGEPEKTFCGVPMSETELELVDTTKKINNKKPAPTYEDADIPLFEEIKQVAHIEHACVLDAECIDSLGDYSDVVTSLLSLADVRKFTIVEHTLSGSISLKKGRKEVEFTPDGSDYIDSDAMLEALNEFLPICGAKGKIFSLWTPDMLQTEMFFYTEDTEAVENYSAENLQTDESVDFEDMKGEIKW